jgi:hypothetical protein
MLKAKKQATNVSATAQGITDVKRIHGARFGRLMRIVREFRELTILRPENRDYPRERELPAKACFFEICICIIPGQ